jgi:hypothetical protein
VVTAQSTGQVTDRSCILGGLIQVDREGRHNMKLVWLVAGVLLLLLGLA